MKKLITLMAGVVLSAGAHAATVTFTDSFDLATTNWTHLLGGSQFNAALGTLNSATFTFTDDIVQRIRGENTGATPDTLTPLAGAQFQFRKSLATLMTTTLSAAGATFNATAFDGVSDFAGTSGIDFGNILISATDTLTLTGGALASVIGTGTLGSAGYDVRALGQGAIQTGNGNLDSSISTQARYNLTVVYDYTPTRSEVPLPGTLALMGGAFAALGMMRRKAINA